MGYEIEFIGVDEETQDATAICMRWKNDDDTYTIGVYDGGINIYGKELKNHLDEFYFNGEEEKVIDFVICSHPHLDHASGLTEILNNFDVKKLYMNRPWNHVKDLYDYVRDKRKTEKTLGEVLEEEYPYIKRLEEIADDREIPIFDIFEGDVIEDKLRVLSPSKNFYLQLLVESSKTKALDKSDNKELQENLLITEKVAHLAKKVIKWITEGWSEEHLHEDVSTEPDNETSVVILGEMDEENFLLTGDVGIRGLQNAIDYSNKINKILKDIVEIYEIPHHGGRHNVSTSILNQLIGDVVDEGEEISKQAFVCSGKNSDHPLQLVVNAYKRRGVKVFSASGKTIWHHVDMPRRENWGKVDGLDFKSEVEEWS